MQLLELNLPLLNSKLSPTNKKLIKHPYRDHFETSHYKKQVAALEHVHRGARDPSQPCSPGLIWGVTAGTKVAE